jgi:hypothetical protein
MCGALWTLQNLSFESGITNRLIQDFKMHEIDMQILCEHFIYPAAGQNTYEPGHFSKILKL